MSVADKTIVRHGTATPGGGFPVYGEAYAATINEMDPTLSVQPQNTKGSTENVPLLEAGKLDTGQVTGEVFYEAISGIGRAPNADEIGRITAKHTFIKPITLPADSYPGQKVAVATVGSWSFVLVRPTLPDDVAYRLACALHQDASTLGARLEQARESTLANTLAAAPRVDLIHPGTQKYMRVIGLLK